MLALFQTVVAVLSELNGPVQTGMTLTTRPGASHVSGQQNFARRLAERPDVFIAEVSAGHDL
eukprot:759319-Amphidinium_carterae.2